MDNQDGEVEVSEAGEGRLMTALIRWASTPRLWLQGAILGVLLCALMPYVLDGNGIAYPDEGVYAAQAESLSRGSWWQQRPAADLPGLADSNGLLPEVVRGDMYAGYVRHSLFIRLLAPLWRMGGFGALLFPSLVGGALAAVASGLLARRVDRKLAVPTLWAVALGSPLLFDSFLVSGHTLGAAAVGFAALGAVRVVLDRQSLALAWTLPLVASAVLVRSEGVLYAGAVAAAIAPPCVRAGREHRWSELTRLCGSSLAIAGMATAAYLVDATLARGISGQQSTIEITNRVLGETTDPLRHVWASLLRPGDLVAIVWPSVVIICGLVATALLQRLIGASSVQLSALLVACGGVVWLQAEGRLVTGLVSAFPLLIVGLLLMPRLAYKPVHTYLLTIACLAVVPLVLTGYRDGGASEWGGRFYLPVVIILMPIAMAGLAGWVVKLGHLGAPVAACLVVVVLGTGLYQVRLNAKLRSDYGRIDSNVAAAIGVRPASPTRPLVIFGGVNVGGGSRILWARRSQMDVVAARSLEETFSMVRLAARHGFHEAYLVVPLPDRLLIQVADAWLPPIGWTIEPRLSLGSGFGLYRMHRA